MKKFMAIFLSMLMILALCATAVAEAAPTKDYNGYKLLNLTISLKTGEHHPDGCDDVNHSDDCYNFAYTVNEKYRAILQAEAHKYAANTVWPGGIAPANSADVTDAEILKYLSNQTSDSGETYGTMRVVADRLYRAIKDAGLDPDEDNLSGKADLVDDGYWLIEDVTDVSGQYAANSLILVDTKGAGQISINAKTALPTLEKKVKDIDDGEDADIAHKPWQDSADHDIGDAVPFKLTATLPSNVQNYVSYKLVFHDTLSSGLTLDASKIKVLMYGSKAAADVDTDLSDGTDVTASFTKKTDGLTDGLTDGCTFEVSCDDVLKIAGVTKNTAFVVYYEATLNANAAIGAAGNANTASLEFSNNPYGDGTGETQEDVVKVFTYQLVINKTDSHGHALEGAGFTLYKKNVEGEYVALGQEIKGTEAEPKTTFTWTGLDDGDYKLVETTVPAGYNKMADVLFSITAAHETNSNDPALTSLDGGDMGAGVVEDGKLTGVITKNIVNNTGVVLPETGAKGTAMLIGISSLAVMMAAVFMITRKKMSVYED